jgi:hypothetical protein
VSLRLKNCFQNALRNPTRSETGSQRVLDLSYNDGRSGRKRAEQPIHTYYRLYKEELQPEIDRDFAHRNSSVSQVAHRDQYPLKQLKESPEDVKEAVAKNRLLAGDGAGKAFVWIDRDEVSEDEIMRH